MHLGEKLIQLQNDYLFKGIDNIKETIAIELLIHGKGKETDYSPIETANTLSFINSLYSDRVKK